MIPPGGPINVELDGTKLGPVIWSEWGQTNRLAEAGLPDSIAFERANGQWELARDRDPERKSAIRYGPFKEVFKNQVLFVYATQGTADENAWALAKARFDAESFWYRGNGSIEVVADTDYLTHPERGVRSGSNSKRNVVLYGHADANAAWARLLPRSPVQVRRGSVKVGHREFEGHDLACLFLRPYPGDDTALVGAVSGSGRVGMRLSERLPVCLSGAGLPDCLVVDASMLVQGAGGVKWAGFFGMDWSVDQGEFVGP
jgi:hypothetical protein